MKKLLYTTTLILACALVANSQKTVELAHFDRVIVSPLIDVEFVSGDREEVTYQLYGCEDHQLNIVNNRGKLHLYLDDARYAVKSYHTYLRGVRVKAVITYTSLKKVEIRGEQQVAFKSPISSDKKFLLRAYGAPEIDINQLDADYFKLALYGEADVNMENGTSDKMKVKSIGNNAVNLGEMASRNVKTKLIGEGEITLQVSDHLHVSSIGEANVHYQGNPYITKGLMIGESRIRRN